MTESSYADEGDLAEQATAVGEEESPAHPTFDPDSANEADVAEQLAELPDEDDAYPAG